MKIETILYTRRQKKGFFALSGSSANEQSISVAVVTGVLADTPIAISPGGAAEHLA